MKLGGPLEFNSSSTTGGLELSSQIGALHTLAHSQHITYPVTDVSGLSCRAQLRSTRLVWQALEMCSTLCTTSDFT